MWAVAGIAGPLLGGTLAEVNWSLIFWLNLPLGAIAMLVINRPLKKLAVAGRRHQLDVWGAVLLVIATSTFLLVLNWGGTTYSWTSPQVLGLLALSVLLWIAFGIRLSLAAEPLVSFEVLSNRIALAGCFAMFMVSAVNVGLTVYLPVYAQAYLGLSPAESGYALLGFLLGAVAGATLGGRLTLRVVYAKWITIIGAAISGLALIAAGAMVAQKSLLALELMLLLIGGGMGMTFPVTTVSVQNAVHQMHLGVATGMLIFLRSLGGALGVAVLGAIALGHGIPLGAERGGQPFHVSDPHPFAALYYTMAAIMLVATGIYGLMPHKELRGRPEPAAPMVE
jgi:MFS family permease